ncbi:MAG UNVERIFIED_CONTAM: hypothetical protein LVR18_42225 [Planctomycetaceae bacterium]
MAWQLIQPARPFLKPSPSAAAPEPSRFRPVPDVRLTADNTTLSTDVFNVSGNFTLETTGTGSNREILVGATGVSGFYGDDGGTPGDTTDDTGVRLTNGTLLAVVGASGSLALNTSGTLSLLGSLPLTFDGTAVLEINSTASRVTRSLNVGGVNRTLDVGPNLERLALRNVLATFTDFVELSGDFSVERTVSGSTTTLQLAASSVGAFLGVQRGQSDEFGVRVSGASAALVIEKPSGVAPKFAVRTNLGTVSVPGLPDLNLSGPTALEINRLGRVINVNIPDLDGVNIPLNFSASDLVNRFGGNLSLSIDNFATLDGTFAFEKQNDGGTTEIRVAATGVNTVLGSNPDTIVGNSDDFGARITNARLGGVFYRTSAGAKSYALDAKGTASIVGVDGFTATGELAARVNTTGGVVNETITMPSGGSRCGELCRLRSFCPCSAER